MDASGETITGGRLVTRELAEWVAGLTVEDLPSPRWMRRGGVRGRLPGRVLFVGATKAWGQSIAAFCARQGGGQPESTILATGKKTLSSRAALANGTMALGFEYADFNGHSRAYPFAVTGPWPWPRRGTSRDGVGPLHRHRLRGEGPDDPSDDRTDPARGSTCLRSTAPSGLPPAQPGCSASGHLYTNYALGLAAAFTGGTFQGHEEGAWQRSLNGGMASERGVTAAELAETGFRATELGLEGVQGFSTMYSGGKLDAYVLLDGLGDSFEIILALGEDLPMNLTLHAPVEALLKVMREHDLHHKDIVQIDAGGSGSSRSWPSTRCPRWCAPRPACPSPCRWPLCRASRGRRVHRRDGGGPGDPGHDPQDQGSPGRRSCSSRVKTSQPGRVTVRLKDGREFTEEVLYPKGNPSNPMTEDEFKGKFMDMACSGAGCEAQADEL